MQKFKPPNESSLAYPFSLIFKNMGFETIVQIYHVNRLDFVHLFSGIGITFEEYGYAPTFIIASHSNASDGRDPQIPFI